MRFGKGPPVTIKTAILARFQMMKHLVEHDRIEACRFERHIVDTSLVEGYLSIGDVIAKLFACHREHAGIDVHGVDVADMRQD